MPRATPPENVLDRITEFETTPRPVPPSAADAPADAAVDGDGEIPAASGAQPATGLLAPPPPPAPVEQPPAPASDDRDASGFVFGDPVPDDPPAPAAAPAPELTPPPVPTEAIPVVAPPVPAAELLDLGGHRQGGSDGPKTETMERVLAPLARLRPEHRPVTFRRAKRPRLRRVTRVVRHVDTWSIFKVAFVFNVVLYGVCLTAGVLLWNVAYTTGTIDNIENFFEQFGWESFEFRGGELYHNAWIAGLFVAVGLTGFAVLLATLFNLITDLVGGVRVTVLEEEFVARPASRSVAKGRESQPVAPAAVDAPAPPIPPVDATV